MSEVFRGSASAIPKTRLRGPRYDRVTRGLYVEKGTLLDVRTRVQAALLAFPGAVVCGNTAALLQNLPVDDDGVVHLCRGQWAPRTTRQEVVINRLDVADDEVIELKGIRMTDGPRTLSDLAAKASAEDLVAIADVVARRYGVAAVQEAARRSWGRPGVVLLREAASRCDPGADSPAETRARLRLHAAGFTRLRHGVRVLDAAGGWLATVDLGDEVAKVAVQHEGAVHFEKGERQRMHDVARDELTRAEGWDLVISTAVDDGDAAQLITKVTSAYFRAAQRLGEHVLPGHLQGRWAA